MSTRIDPDTAATREANRRTDGKFGQSQHPEQDSFEAPAATVPARETTLSKYNHPSQRGNYCKLPTIDVEILDEVNHCASCHVEIRFEKQPGHYSGSWVHADDPKACKSKYITAQASCRYCNNDKAGTVKYRQDSWADVSVCTRCGGESGFAIGD